MDRYTYRGSRPELARKDSQTCVLLCQFSYHGTTYGRAYTYRSHEFDGRHFRSLYTHVSLLYMGNFVGELYDVRSMVLASFGFRLSEEGDNNGQYAERRNIQSHEKQNMLGTVRKDGNMLRRSI